MFKIKQIHAVDGIAYGNSPQPRSALASRRDARGRPMVRIYVLLAVFLLAASNPVAARAVSDILRDATRCFAAYDAAYKTAELNLDPIAKSGLAPQRHNWLSLMWTIARIASVGKSKADVASISGWQARLYRRQYSRVVQSIATGDAAVFTEVHEMCLRVKDEIRAAIAETR
jgi:hypothetical protein